MTKFATRLRTYLLFTTTLLLLAQLAVAAPTKIKDCGTVIDQPGDYVLANDINCPGEGIRILTGGVHLDLNSHVIGSTNPRSNNGITIHDAGRVEVRGPGAITGFNHGFDLTASPGPIYITVVQTSGNNIGFFGSGLGVAGIYQCTADNGTYGFFLKTDNTELGEDSASENTDTGYQISGARNYVFNSRAYHNAQRGIATQDGSGVDNHIVDNTALKNGRDLYEGNPTCLNEWRNNTHDTDNKDCIH